MTATTATLTITIPLTNDDCLGPNSRCSWYARAQQTRDLRQAAKLATLDLVNRHGRPDLPADGPIGLAWTIFWAKRRKAKDDDNFYGGVGKALRDGICDALNVSDARIVLRGVLQLQTTARQSEAVAELTGGEQ